MSLLTVILNKEQDRFIDDLLDSEYSSKADIVREALDKFKEDYVVKKVLLTLQEIKDGKGIEGNTREAYKNFTKADKY